MQEGGKTETPPEEHRKKDDDAHGKSDVVVDEERVGLREIVLVVTEDDGEDNDGAGKHEPDEVEQFQTLLALKSDPKSPNADTAGALLPSTAGEVVCVLGGVVSALALVGVGLSS